MFRALSRAAGKKLGSTSRSVGQLPSGTCGRNFGIFVQHPASFHVSPFLLHGYPMNMLDAISGRSFFDQLDDFFDFPRPMTLAPRRYVQPPRGPVASCRVLEDAVELEFEVPRFRAEHVTVTGDKSRGQLIISGDRTPQRRDEGSQRSLQTTGTSNTSFRRAFEVDIDVYDLDAVSHNLQDGVLVVKIPFRKVESPEQSSTSSSQSETSIPVQQTESSKQADVSSTDNAAATQDANSQVNMKESGKTPVASNLTEAKNEVAETKNKDSDHDWLFQWPPRMQVSAKSDASPLTFTVTMPEGVREPSVSLRLLEGGLLAVDISYTSRSQSEFGFSQRHGSFSRTFPLPSGVSAEDVSARMEDGKLIIEVKEKQGTATDAGSKDQQSAAPRSSCAV